MRFGEYLIQEKFVTEEQITEALDVQRHIQVDLGSLAVELGYLNNIQNLKVLLERYKSQGRYGEIAEKMGLLNPTQISELLTVQKNEAIHIGTILVDLQYISKTDQVIALKKFVREILGT